MTAKEKAKELVNLFGTTIALKVVDELLKRDKQWVEKLAIESPDSWVLSDFDKSIEMFTKVKEEISILDV